MASQSPFSLFPLLSSSLTFLMLSYKDPCDYTYLGSIRIKSRIMSPFNTLNINTSGKSLFAIKHIIHRSWRVGHGHLWGPLLSLSITGQMILCFMRVGGRGPVHCRMFSCIPQVLTVKNASKCCQMSPEGQNPHSWESLFYMHVHHLFILLYVAFENYPLRPSSLILTAL